MEPHTIRAGVVARVSTKEQAAEGTTSLDEQVGDCRAEIERRGWEFAGAYADTITGTTEHRPELERALAACEAGELNAIVVTKIDRLARDEVTRLLILRELRDCDIEFVALDMPHVDYRTDEGEMFGGLLGVFAQFERKRIVRRTVGGQRAKATRFAEDGRWPGGAPPFGYRLEGEPRRGKVPSQARPVPELRERRVIEVAVAAIVDEGRTTGETAALLNGLGLLPRGGQPWTYEALARQLRRRGLMGEVTWANPGPARRRKLPNGEVVNRHHAKVDRRGKPEYGEPITFNLPDPPLTVARFEALQRRLSDLGLQSQKAPDSVWPLSLRMTSPCGRTYYGTASAGRPRRYVCSGRKWRSADHARCSCSRVDADWLEGRVWSEVAALLGEPERLLALASDFLGLRAAQMSAESDQLETVRARIAEREGALTRVVIDYAKAGLPVAAVKAATEEIERELTALRDHERTLAAWRADTRAVSRRMQALWELAEVAAARLGEMGISERAEVLRLLDVRVKVGGDGLRPGALEVAGSVPAARLLAELGNRPAWSHHPMPDGSPDSATPPTGEDGPTLAASLPFRLALAA